MITDPKDAADLNPDNIIPVTFEDLSEDDRRTLEQELEEMKAQRLKQYFKTRNGAIKKVIAPNPTAASGTEVCKSTEEIAHLVDVSVGSKYGSESANTARAITQLSSDFNQFKEQFETNLPRQVRSAVLQINDEHRDKQPIPLENSKFINSQSVMHTPSISANVTQPSVDLNNSQGGRAYASISANTFVPSAAPPIVSTSVPQNYTSNNRSVGFNSNLQQPSYQTVAYNTPPLLPIGTGVPYGPVPDSYFNGSPQQTTHAQMFAGNSTAHLCSI
jgi:hypothetical protein